MPNATIKIAEFKPAHQNDRGKTIPPKILDGNGTDYVVPRELVETVQGFTGKTVEIEFTERQNGKWTNRDLVSAVLPEPPKEKAQGNGWGKSPDEAARICRQNALTNAVAYWGSSATLAKILDTAQLFSKWNLDGIVQMIEVPVGIPAAEQRPQAALPRRYTTGLREGEDLVTAARRAVEEHDPLAGTSFATPTEEDLATIPPADAVEFEGPSVRHPIPAARETLRASGPARR